MLIKLRSPNPSVEIPFHPGPLRRHQSHRMRRQLIAELDGRSANHNVGGSVGTPLVTAYRESCIRIAACLAKRGPLSPAALRELGTGADTLSLLTKNHYGWFLHLRRALYGLSERGQGELGRYPDLVSRYTP